MLWWIHLKQCWFWPLHNWIQLERWNRILHLQTISKLTGIPIVADGNQNPRTLNEYMFLMCNYYRPAQGGEINAKTIYHNVYVVYRWLNYNVLVVSHVSSFYNNALHILHMMITKDKHYCMCRQLFDTISNAKNRRKNFFHCLFLWLKSVGSGCKEMVLTMLRMRKLWSHMQLFHYLIVHHSK